MSHEDPGDELVPGIDFDDRSWYGDVEPGSGVDAIMAARALEWERQLLDAGHDEPSAWERDHPELESEPVEDVAAPPDRCDNCDRTGAYDAANDEYLCCCVRCHAAPALPPEFDYPMCAACLIAVFCKVCGQEVKVANNRCDTCRKYFERTGRERPKRLWAKKRISVGDLDERRRQASRDHADWDRHLW